MIARDAEPVERAPDLDPRPRSARAGDAASLQLGGDGAQRLPGQLDKHWTHVLGDLAPVLGAPAQDRQAARASSNHCCGREPKKSRLPNSTPQWRRML